MAPRIRPMGDDDARVTTWRAIPVQPRRGLTSAECVASLLGLLILLVLVGAYVVAG